MKLLNSVGPNPHVVRMFAAEKNLTLPLEEIDLMGGANRQDEYLAKNPGGQLPCLQADDGTYIAEITAICEYLDEVGGGESLIGNTAEEKLSRECGQEGRPEYLRAARKRVQIFRGLTNIQGSNNHYPRSSSRLEGNRQIPNRLVRWLNDPRRIYLWI